MSAVQIAIRCTLTILFVSQVQAAPTSRNTNIDENETSKTESSTSTQTRSGKQFPYYDILPQNDYIDTLNDYSEIEDAGNEVLPRGSFSRPHNSPIYYIRLPPSPYMFVPGLGYVSQPPAVSPLGPTSNPFINLPISFVANGKPDNIYQWSSSFPAALPSIPIAPKPAPKPTPKPKPESTVHNLPNSFAFNGKPTNILVLRDSYNSLYGDALQNFYP